jgi:hypothetical protein
MRRATRLAVRVATALLFVPMLWPLVRGRIFAYDDLLAFFLPLRFLYQQALRSGESFVWTSALYSGDYVQGEGQTGMTHPLHLLLYGLLPLGWAFNAETVISFVVLWIGMRKLLVRAGLSDEAAWLGALTFTFSGFNLLHLQHLNGVAVIAHLPWLILATNGVLTGHTRQDRANAGAGLALLVGSELLVGYPQYVWLTGFATLTFALWQVRRPERRARLPIFVFAGLTGVLLGGIQVGPTVDALRHSVRAGEPAAFHLTFSLPPLDLVDLWSPYAFRARIVAPPGQFEIHELAVYAGALAFASLAWLAVRRRAVLRRPLWVAVLVFSAVNAWLALGRYGGLYDLMTFVPGVATFRAPTRHFMLTEFGLAALVALVFDDLRTLLTRGTRLPWSALWPLALPTGLGVLTTIALATLAHSAWAVEHWVDVATLPHAAVGVGLAAATALLLVAGARGWQSAVPLLVLVSALDLGAWGYLNVYRVPPRTLAAVLAAAPIPADAVPGETLATAPDELRPINLAVMRGLRLSGATWQRLADGWRRLTDPLPRARLLAEAAVSRNIASEVEAVDVATIALVSAPVGPLSGPPGTAQVVIDRPGQIEIATEAPGTQILALTERFHDGWDVRIDGRPAATERIDGDWLGCVVDAGRHKVVFTFAPASLRAGEGATLVGVLLTGVLAVAALRRPRAAASAGAMSPSNRVTM